ncbi:hypothetical protein RIB2604_00800370 [Aspergillus luchuensis]|uniref:Uncharacterized protein n=1 Tax=Aspergillus kawachii TaxID=1069201 RepID=A0A146F380_ASPKA|nr:hypothetical protein RIB2604_00800370 [Aspergillus luchuensis]
MKVTATIAAVALAFAASTRAATCTPGLDYCSNVLLDVGEIALRELTGLLGKTNMFSNQDPSNRNAISQTLQSSGGGDYANDHHAMGVDNEYQYRDSYAGTVAPNDPVGMFP